MTILGISSTELSSELSPSSSDRFFLGTSACDPCFSLCIELVSNEIHNRVLVKYINVSRIMQMTYLKSFAENFKSESPDLEFILLDIIFM